MLEQLFGSKTRAKLLGLFLASPSRAYYVRELVRQTKSQINSVRRELDNLTNLGIIKVIEKEKLADLSLVLSKKLGEGREEKKIIDNFRKKFFQLNQDFILYPEFKALFLKAKLLLEKDFVEKIKEVGKINYLALTGIFVDLEEFPTDLLVVGQINHQKFEKLIHNFEKSLGRTVNYTIMSQKEFKYRRDITDRFLYSILEGRKIVMIEDL